MLSREVAERWDGPPELTAAGALPARSGVVGALVWAGLASTLHRLRRGEGALLAVNLSLVAYQGLGRANAFAAASISVLAIALMYAFNDLYDAPTDATNPKKDHAVVSTYHDHRLGGAIAIFVLHLVTVGLAAASLGIPATAALAGTMAVNVVYSTLLKGVPVADVIACGLWGALYAAIVDATPALMVLVGLMTAVCHLYQTLDDRAADAANAIITTAVRSAALSRNVLIALSVLLYLALRPAVGSVWAVTAFAPLAIFFTCESPRTGWLLTKVYFGVTWLAVLEIVRAAG